MCVVETDAGKREVLVLSRYHEMKYDEISA
jgi:hypothetical protein